jgi:hypothetical protein
MALEFSGAEKILEDQIGDNNSATTIKFTTMDS